MKYHAEKYKHSCGNQWAVVDEVGSTILVCMTEGNARFHADLLNAQHNKTTKP